MNEEIANMDLIAYHLDKAERVASIQFMITLYGHRIQRLQKRLEIQKSDGESEEVEMKELSRLFDIKDKE